MPKKNVITSAADFLPTKLNLSSLKKAATHCEGCHLYKLGAQQTVFGEGSVHAKLMIVGEIPGEKEDDLGEPFVGPAGKLLRNTIENAGISDEDIYFTNVVKHFKFAFLNNRKLHRSPNGAEIKACIPWLNAEINVIHPKAILCLGGTAAKALVSKDFLILTKRGRWFKYANDIPIMATYHPSAILRTNDDEARHAMKKIFLRDIKKAASAIKNL